ncbi:protein dehydration-induced 19 homolog 4 [Phtheirospermum japonicum]|uniref:Protein dehydration-induced 19 homolog 4 n=1 Tax=Phtheirospermum japonicum TaxID=374723 RepID=A0A830BM30_9LAMI|nr:protein dehydration-induced 19 homolog 4 [Phtheirospermum japonicum]
MEIRYDWWKTILSDDGVYLDEERGLICVDTTIKVYRGEECDGDEELRPEFLCPFCAEEFDVVGLCCHIDEEHSNEASNGRRRRFRRGGSNFSFSMLKKELGEGKFQSLLGGSSFPVSSTHDKPDPLLTTFMHNPPATDEPSSAQLLSSIDPCPMAQSTVKGPTHGAVEQTKMSDEDQKERARKCEFMHGLLLSTFLDDNL